MQRFFQFTLDLFDTAPSVDLPAPQVQPPARRAEHRQYLEPGNANSPAASKFGSNQALAPVLPSPDAIEKRGKIPRDGVATVQQPIPAAGWSRRGNPTVAGAPTPQLSISPARPPKPLLQNLSPVSFRHPQATREIVLAGLEVAYEFKRGKRRTIGFTVGHEGLAVRAPKWVTLADVDKAVKDKASWIVKKLKETRARHQCLESARVEWKEGALIRFMGRDVRVVLDPSHAFSGVGAALVASAGDGNEKTPVVTSAGSVHEALHVGLPHSAGAEQIRDSVQAWLMRQAKQLFIERLDHFKPALGVQWRKLSLSSAGTRWGSASADGSIRLNWRLIHFRLDVIDYVVVHELSHLRVMDHSPRFWDTVRSVVPDYARLRADLKAAPIPRW